MTIKEATAAYSQNGIAKSKMSWQRMLVLAILAGVYLAFAGAVSTIASCMIENPSVSKLVAGLLFSPGLIFVILNGTELFTGNCLMVISVLDHKITVPMWLRNMCIVYAGNLIGSVLTSAVMVFGHVFSLFSGAAGNAAFATALAKVSISFSDGLLKGILCNFLVCTAVMMASTQKELPGKAIGAALPVILFVIGGFEHSIANMSYIANGLFLQAMDPALSGITLGGFFLGNLLPVTVGNIIGGCLAGIIYWYTNIQRTE